MPQLVDLLDEPDPTSAQRQTVGGKQVLVVRELVRVNHLRNCLLCHAPATSNQDRVRGPIPTPGEPLPTSAQLYYAERSGISMVKAEVTYLRQDFSVALPVEEPGAWPTYQRFDFLVRARPLTAAELAGFAAQAGAAERPPSAQRQALLYALRVLTGQDAGTAAQAWRELLRAD